MRIFLSTICLISLCFPSLHAEETSPTTAPPAAAPETQSRRSNRDARFWIGGNFAVAGSPFWGVDAGAGLGRETQLNVALKLGRCGPMFDWHVQKVHYWDPADLTNTVFGLGVTCRLVYFKPDAVFAAGAHVAAKLQAQIGKSRYHLISRNGNEVDSGLARGTGALAGFDIYFPIYYGFWLNGGTGLELMNYDYKTPKGTEFEETNSPNWWLYAHVGLSYAF
jgi:hypothetical protein